MLDGLQERGELETTNLFVTSDHGFSQLIGGRPSYASLLIDRGLKASTTSDDVVISGEAIHVADGGPERVAAIVRALQETAGVGAIFTRGEPGSVQGSAPGTLSLAMANWDHVRSAEVLVFTDWLPSPFAGLRNSRNCLGEPDGSVGGLEGSGRVSFRPSNRRRHNRWGEVEADWLRALVLCRRACPPYESAGIRAFCTSSFQARPIFGNLPPCHAPMAQGGGVHSPILGCTGTVLAVELG